MATAEQARHGLIERIHAKYQERRHKPVKKAVKDRISAYAAILSKNPAGFFGPDNELYTATREIDPDDSEITTTRFFRGGYQFAEYYSNPFAKGFQDSAISTLFEFDTATDQEVVIRVREFANEKIAVNAGDRPIDISHANRNWTEFPFDKAGKERIRRVFRLTF